MAKIGFVGIGQMGRAMCPHLIRNGHDVTVYDISNDAVAPLEQAGAKVANSPKQAAEAAEVIFSILPIGSIVEQVVFGRDGIADGMSDHAIFVDMSTILPDETRSIGKRLAERGLSMVDAPVGRTSAHAIDGKSTFMVGGKKSDVERVTPFWSVWERR